MVIGILNFGDGLLWLTYWIFCIVGALGVLQIAAARARLIGLLLLPPQPSQWLGAALVAGAFVGFFTIQPDLFIPGLAGGEFFVEFFLGFGLAVLIALGLGILSNRIARPAPLPPHARELIHLAEGQPAELWLPSQQATPPLVLALREANADALDVLSGRLVTSGAAVLLCDQAFAPAAMKFAEQFNASRRYVMGVGRGADRALQLAATEQTLHGVLALAPFGNQANAAAGLRWLGETDYVSAFRATWRQGEIATGRASEHALVVYGDEDLLIPPERARQMFPDAILVAGARHWTLAAMPATFQLAVDLFEVHPSATRVSPIQTHAAAMRGEPGE